MFDPCRFWRKQLSRRADGCLSHAEEAALEDHLAHCPRCRVYAAADRELKSALTVKIDLLDPVSARRFDNRVVARALRPSDREPACLPDAGWRREVTLRWRRLPFGFLRQIAGGALAAASLTALLLFSALRPAGSGLVKADVAPGHEGIAPTRNDPPVPLESLLRSPSPRAALLWTTPSVRHATFTMPASLLRRPPARQKRQVPASDHSALPNSIVKS
jgi:hypothetical protein